MDRRKVFLAGLAAGGAGIAGTTTWAQTEPAPLPPPFSEFKRPGNDVAAHGVGSAPPRLDEIVKAFQLIIKAPRSNKPIDIAHYFAGLTDVNTNTPDGKPVLYRSEWKNLSRANPLVVDFFSATFTAPSAIDGDGDQVAWCSAFVNTMLMMAGKTGTWSALSGSFRNAKNLPPTNNPQVGDIVVLRDDGPGGDQGHGHVGFLDAPYDRATGYIKVLGGNQGGANGGEIRSDWFFKPGSGYGAGKTLHSFRSVPA